MQVVEEEYELRQMKDMAAARKRWEALVYKIISIYVEIDLLLYVEYAGFFRTWDVIRLTF